MARLAFDLSVLRVLLVEGETFARELEKTALHHLNISRVTLAVDAAEAVDALERGFACDMIICDWSTVSEDEAPLQKTVRQRWPGIPFLMITNNESLDRIETAREEGIDGVLIKPFSLDKLREAMQLTLIGKLTGDARPMAPIADNPELEKVTDSIRCILARSQVEKKSNGEAVDFKDTNKLAEKLSGLLTGFVGTLSNTDPQKLAVIQLHLDCLQAVLSGREDLLSHETRNMMLDGLSYAADLVSE